MTVQLKLNTFSEPSPLLAARRRGFLEREGIEVEVIQAKGSRPQIEGLLAGDWQLAHTNADNIMKFRGQGNEELFIFAVADRGIAQKLVVHPEITDWEDIRGKAVGVDAPDSGYAFVVYELLKRHGLPSGSYEVKPLGATSYRLAGLRSGEVVAGLLSQHHETSALDDGFKILADTSEHFPEHAGLTAATTHSWADANRELLMGYTRGLLSAASWAFDPANTDEVVAMVADFYGTSQEEGRRLLSNERAARSAGVPTADEAAVSLRTIADLRASVTGTQPTDYFDPQYMRAALGAAGPA